MKSCSALKTKNIINILLSISIGHQFYELNIPFLAFITSFLAIGGHITRVSMTMTPMSQISTIAKFVSTVTSRLSVTPVPRT